MLNKERIILMTKLASYEQKEGKKDAAVYSYFKGDYIGLQVIKSVVSATIAFGILFVLAIFYDFEVFMADVYKMDMLGFARNVMILYLCTVGVYGILAYFVYLYRYKKTKANLKRYYNNLKRLSRMYTEEK